MKKLIVSILSALLLTSCSVKAQQTVELDGRVESFSVIVLTYEIEKLHEALPMDKPIIIKLNSPGGSVFAGYELMNKIKAMQIEGRKFIGVVTSLCASMCFNILQSLDVRTSYPYGSLMQHLPYGGDEQHLEVIERAMDRLTSKRIGIHIRLWKQIARANLWVDPFDAVEMNILDKVVVEIRRSEEYIKLNGEESKYINLQPKVKGVKVCPQKQHKKQNQ